MAEELTIDPSLPKAEKYNQLIPQINALVEGEHNLVANMSNVMAALRTAFEFFWVGVYLVDQQQPDELVLGPFQGPIACTRIKKGRGVCGAAWQQAKTIIVPDVDQFPGHIACSSASKSEIVIPVYDENKEVVMVIDVDSEMYNTFDTIDQHYLEQISAIITQCVQKASR
jgi:L-methionine (R)-S-oxide reductase